MQPRDWVKKVLRVLLVLCGVAHCWAGALSEFDQGNRLYEQGNYAEAISQYEALLKSGRSSAAVWFNLGNAYFKRGELGRAIYSYRRARSLAPRDPDIQANLQFARDRITGSASAQLSVLDKVVQRFTLNELTVTAALLFWILIGLLIWTRYRASSRSPQRNYISVTAALTVLSCVLLTAAYNSARQKFAIVTRNQFVVHLGPLAESQAAFTVPDGTELLVENQREGWLQVIDRSNRSGWVQADKVLQFP